MLSGNLEVDKNCSEDLLAFPRIVHLSSVEVVDAILEGNLDDSFVLFVIFWLAVDHISKRNS